MPINDAGLAIIQEREDCRLEAYLCPSDVWTIGWGHTGPEVKKGLRWTQSQCDQTLKADVKLFEDGVAKLTKDAAGGTSSNEESAMISLAYNIGLGNFRDSSVLRYHMRGDKKSAAKSFGLWKYSKGRILQGLVDRRADEAKLYLTPDGK